MKFEVSKMLNLGRNRLGVARTRRSLTHLQTQMSLALTVCSAGLIEKMLAEALVYRPVNMARDELNKGNIEQAVRLSNLAHRSQRHLVKRLASTLMQSRRIRRVHH